MTSTLRYFSFIILYFATMLNAYPNYTIQEQNLKSHINYFTSDTLAGRMTGSEGEKLATQYIAEIFRQLNLEPLGDNGTFFQYFEFKGKRARNVLAKLKVDHTDAPKMIIIGAHVDHLGRMHPGADDNASGVASVIEAALKLSDLKKQNKLSGDKDIIFAIWSGEEFGLLGSTHFLKKFPQKPEITSYINLDMVGHFKKKLIVQGVGGSADWKKILDITQQKNTLPISQQTDPYLPTDTTAFYLAKIPALNFFTGSHTAYHTQHDTTKTLNLTGIQRITNFLVDLTLTLENSQPLDYRKVKKTHENTGRGFKVYLGTIPDYASQDVPGVKLSGVTYDSPAEHAGLAENDVIIALAGKTIQNIYDYSHILNSLQANIAVKIVVLREQQKMTLTVLPVLRH